ncbi:beta-ketoacyl synthase chain length factor [Desulfotalea psychrophila]|uniref:Beta-ketoacyl synthase-like N-terminal domain-containing protein n=1 Tax=Desulfotalea psychrophila (strain LSv54 / DSM 12343) TaxID=177439 RepID=Q6AM48_DESPS|nr:beta-ketoacyl synthase chain length factor [Desulfotalea psychrophila]CAG36577.1 unknown protein [Desulfotalea psychrophila LSv54]
MTVYISQVYAGLLTELEIPVDMAKHLRRADDFIRLGTVAAHEVLGRNISPDARGDISQGLFLSTFAGPMDTNFSVLREVAHRNPLSPTLFSHSVANSAVGYMANTFNIQGCAMSYTDFEFPFFRALEQAMMAIESGLLSSCLVLQVETYSQLLEDVRQKNYAEEDNWQAGAVCWLLSSEKSTADNQFKIDRLSIEGRNRSDVNHLLDKEEALINEELFRHSDPLTSAYLLSERLQRREEHLHCTLESVYGSVHLDIRLS